MLVLKLLIFQKFLHFVHRWIRPSTQTTTNFDKKKKKMFGLIIISMKFNNYTYF